MVNTRQAETVWMDPAPLWSLEAEQSAKVLRAKSNPPLILRFVTDNFMEEFNELLSTEPERISEYRVRPETWRGFSRPELPRRQTDEITLPLRRFGLDLPIKKVAKKTFHPPAASVAPLKLYQPAHQRFYLVTSSLICDTESLPDCQVAMEKGERVGFVVRRLWPAVKSGPEEELGFPDSTWKEFAFVQQDDGTCVWNLINDADFESLQKNEEIVSMFPVTYAHECRIHGRRLWAGLIPVGRREAYMGAMSANSPAASAGSLTPLTARKVLFRTQIAEPWKSLVDTAVSYREMKNTQKPDFVDDDPPADSLEAHLKQIREQIQTVSWLILADFREFLIKYNRSVWDQVVSKNPGTLTGNKRMLFDALHGMKMGKHLSDILINNMGSGSPVHTVSSLADALLMMEPAVVDRMESAYANFVIGSKNPDFPEFLFPLVDPQMLQSSLQLVFTRTVLPDEDSSDTFDVNGTVMTDGSVIGEAIKNRIDQLAAVVIRAMDETYEAAEPCIPLAAMRPADLREGWFVIRCVYERPSCPVHFNTRLVSLSTEPFQMAGFFDSDAPARPVRIGLPLDTTPAGLRKFNKNTAFVISDVLCGQIRRMRGITLGDMVLSVLPWPFHKNLPGGSGGPCKKSGINMGTICSLSIPIITLCAILLLMVMVSLFDIIFKWLPFFCICFPIPGLRAKKK